MLGLKLNHVSKRGHWTICAWYQHDYHRWVGSEWMGYLIGQNDMLYHDRLGKSCCCTILYKMLIAGHETVKRIYMNSCSSRNKLHIWTIHVKYLDDWGYISGRFALRIIMVVVVGFENQLDLNGLKWHAMEWCDMKIHAVVHYYTKYQSHSRIIVHKH